ncbi:MAG: ATP synthase subunit I [Bacillota bacterium]|jgi:uncharacterized Tic20 family protein
MWMDIVKSLLIGLAFGALVGLFNHWLVWSVLKKSDQFTPAQAKNKLMMRYIFRYFINVAVLATYLLHRDTYVLIGTAVGLTILGKILAVNYSFLKRG